MKKLFLTAGVLAFATLGLFTSCKDADVPAVPTAVADATIDQSQVNQAKNQASTNLTTESQAAAAAAAVAQAGTKDNGDGTTTTTGEAATTTVGDNTVVTQTATTTDTSGNTVSTETSTTTITTTANADALPTTTATTVVETKDANGNVTDTKTSTTTTTYSYTFSVDGVEYKTEAEMLNALKGKTTTATVVITLVETTTTVGFDGKVTTTTRVSTQTSVIEVPQGTQTTTAIIKYPTTIAVDNNGVSLSDATVSVTIVPTGGTNQHSGGAIR